MPEIRSSSHDCQVYAVMRWTKADSYSARSPSVAGSSSAWATSPQQPPGPRIFGALSAAGVTFLSVAGLGITIAMCLSQRS